MLSDCCALPYGSYLCHCGACHQTFSGLGLFDRHQDVDYRRRPAVQCKPAGTLGLVRDDRGTWRTPESLAGLTQKIARMADARSRKAA